MARIKESHCPTVGQPGPRVTSPEAIARLETECAMQVHGAKRSAGTTMLYSKFKGVVSRRDLLHKVAEARRHRNAQYRRNQYRLSWRGSGVAWAMDDTEYKTTQQTYYITNVRDLGAQYVMEPMVKATVASGAEIASNLERLFMAHGAPLFLKRDNGSNLCSHEVNEVLARWLVLPLTSPPHHPQFNGAIEWSQGQLKAEIDHILEDRGNCVDDVSLHAKLASHSINHRCCQALHGQCPCYSRNTSLVHFGRNERRSMLDWINEIAEAIFLERGPNVDRRAAWRQAVTRWLTSNGLLTIKKAKQVSTDFEADVCP